MLKAAVRSCRRVCTAHQEVRLPVRNVKRQAASEETKIATGGPLDWIVVLQVYRCGGDEVECAGR